MIVGDLDADGASDLATMYDYTNDAKIHVWLSNRSSAFSFDNGVNGWWTSDPGSYDVGPVSGRFATGAVSGQ